MIILVIIGLATVAACGALLIFYGWQLCKFTAAFTGKHSPMGYFMMLVGTLCFLLAYYLSPFTFAVKVTV